MGDSDEDASALAAERSPREVVSIESLVERYAAFLFDQFGVLHDGVDVFAGMHATLRAIKEAGRGIGVITNSGKRADCNRARLARFGFGGELIDVVASSGEVAWRELAVSRHAPSSAPPVGSSAESSAGEAGLPQAVPSLAPDGARRRRVLIVGRGANGGFLDGLPLIETTDAAVCELVLISGCEPERTSLAEYRDRLAPAARRGVPALCTNPDRVMLLGGERGFAPGVVADAYEALGGPVRRIGKPWPAIYAHALAELDVDGARTLCIGDSVEHDVAGAQAAGCHSLLVPTGIHAGASAAERAALFETHRAWPTWTLVDPR